MVYGQPICFLYLIRIWMPQLIGACQSQAVDHQEPRTVLRDSKQEDRFIDNLFAHVGFLPTLIFKSDLILNQNLN